MMRPLLLAFLGCPLWLAALGAEGAGEDVDAADEKAAEASRVAQEAVRAGRTGEAREILGSTLEGLREAGRLTRGSEALLEFSRGYALESTRDASGACSESHLREALAAYGRVLELYPQNVQATVNLAFVHERLGETAAAIGRLQDAMRGEPDRAGDYLLGIGDLQLAQGDAGGACESYDKALAHEGSDARVRPRMLAACSKLARDRDGLLLGYADHLVDRGCTSLALDLLVFVIHRNCIEAPSLAESALVKLVNEEARLGVVSSATLDRLPTPGVWKSPALVQLHALVRQLGPRDSISWWLEDEPRKHVAAAVLRVLAGGLARDGEIQTAAATYRNAMAWAPPVGFYEESRPAGFRTPIVLDIAADLARLYNVHPELDADGKGFEGLFLDLFEGKDAAYRTLRLESIYRYHVTLGIILSERGTWGMDVRGAGYHLDRALETEAGLGREPGARREARPRLHALVAEAYRRNGRAIDAARAQQRVVEDYLDLDDLRSAKSALDALGGAVRSLPAVDSEAFHKDVKILDGVLQNRVKIRGLDRADLEPERPPGVGPTPPKPDPRSRIDGGFLRRQEFKTLADLSVRAEVVGARGPADTFRKEAVDLYRAGDVQPLDVDRPRLEALELGTKAAVLPKSAIKPGFPR